MGWWARTFGAERAAVKKKKRRRRAMRAIGEQWRRMGGSRSVNELTKAHGALVRREARYLARTNAHAARAVEGMTRAVVGAGIIPRTATNSEPFNELVDRRIGRWANRECDPAGQLTLYAMQSLVTCSMLVSGEVFARRLHRRASDGLTIPLQVQLLEADYCPEALNETLENGNRIVQGIEHDEGGRRIAYYFHKAHPGDAGHLASPRRADLVRVPAEDVAHVFETVRPGQVRGYTRLAPIAKALADLDEFQDAKIVQQKMAACLGVIFHGPGADEELDEDEKAAVLTRYDGTPIDDFYSGMVGYLDGDYDVRVLDPPDAKDYDAFVAARLREVATGIGVTYEMLTGDLTGVNFASSRIGMHQFQALVQALQWQVVIPQFCGPVWNWAIDADYAAGNLTVPQAAVEWATPHVVSINPVQDVKAAILRMRAGLVSHAEETAKLGYNPRLMLKQRAAEKKLMADLELLLDCNPWDVTAAGIAQYINDTTLDDGEDEERADAARAANIVRLPRRAGGRQ